MGFLKFLRKEKKKELDELDLPPAPPPLEGFDEDLSIPDFSGFGEKQEMPEFDFSDKDFQSLEDMKDFPSFPESQEKTAIPTISMPPPFMSDQQPEVGEKAMPMQQMPKERPIFTQERRMNKSLYIRVEKFKVALGSINVVRNDLKKTEEALIKLEEIKSNEEKSMNKIKSSLDDLQKKLVFIDKTLFEGE